MITIYKYTIDHMGDVHLPSKHKFLTVQMQNGKATLWFQVDTDSKDCIKTYSIYGTRWEINEHEAAAQMYLGTVQDTDGFVWHIFEKQG